MDDQKLNRSLLEIYQRLFAKYGPQHWWPAETTFEVIVGAILTQSAAWTNVEKAINNLKRAGALNPDALRRVPQDELAELVYSCGYYNMKARKLKAFADWFGKRYNDNLERLFSGETGELRRQLLAVYGIGEETADSILLYAGNKPVFVIDAYTRRILTLMGLAPSNNSYTAWQILFMANLPADVKLYNEYHALIVRLAKEVCRTRPLCPQCCFNLSSKAAGEPFPCRKFINFQ